MSSYSEYTSNQANVEDIFTLFHNDEICMKRLSEARRWLMKEKDGFCLLKILNCNGYKSVPFSNAFCDVSRNVYDPDKRKTFTYSSIFEHGFSTLDAFIESPVNVPQRRGERIALERLLRFLMYFVNGCQRALSLNTQTRKRVTESDWAIRLTHHMLSKLAANQNYILDDRKGGTETCPCCQEKLLGKFEDTSIGCTAVWHGFVDIILGKDSNPVPISIAFETDPDLPLENDSSEMGETVRSSFEQMISETIVFSHLHKKLNPDDDNFLIPTIDITKEDVSIFLYDCDNDVLLESSPMPLLNYDDLAMPTVLAIWLAVNYKYFCSGTPDCIKQLNYTADFPKHVASVYKAYKEDVDYHCGISKLKRDSFNPSRYSYMNFVFGR